MLAYLLREENCGIAGRRCRPDAKGAFIVDLIKGVGSLDWISTLCTACWFTAL